MIVILTFLIISNVDLLSQTDTTTTVDQTQINKQIAYSFYQVLWFTNHTENYGKYVVHDIGDRKSVTEPAIEQKHIADFFWKHGTMRPEIDFQIAEDDLVATRWSLSYEPETLFGKIVLGKHKLPIINVFRMEDGKIVEIWNHRHDIDTRQTLKFTLQGFLIGLLIALIPTFFVIRQKRYIKRLKAD
ncbi:MAG: hypothetical protein GVY20_07050 [Bacteroidetes bacterium]|jgi:predicted SnoaL-like aldol condensation-catalyzing enzyme|nr:hypothetical protein [Bacteroidota bacterium]